MIFISSLRSLDNLIGGNYVEWVFAFNFEQVFMQGQNFDVLEMLSRFLYGQHACMAISVIHQLLWWVEWIASLWAYLIGCRIDMQLSIHTHPDFTWSFFSKTLEVCVEVLTHLLVPSQHIVSDFLQHSFFCRKACKHRLCRVFRVMVISSAYMPIGVVGVVSSVCVCTCVCVLVFRMRVLVEFHWFCFALVGVPMILVKWSFQDWWVA